MISLRRRLAWKRRWATAFQYRLVRARLDRIEAARSLFRIAN